MIYDPNDFAAAAIAEADIIALKPQVEEIQHLVEQMNNMGKSGLGMTSIMMGIATYAISQIVARDMMDLEVCLNVVREAVSKAQEENFER